jgi:putative addiction module killer protein
VLEARLDFGSGYRVYFGFAAKKVILLLIGGDKRTQKHDVRTAQAYWQEYLEVTHGETK